MSNSYQRAKARVKELEEQNLLIQRELSAYKESDAQLSNALSNANHKLKLADHYSTKLRESYEEQLDNRNQMIDVREKQVETYKQQTKVQKRAIKSLAILAIILSWAVIGLLATS